MRFAAMFFQQEVFVVPYDDLPILEMLGGQFAFEIQVPSAILSSVGWLADTEDGLMNIFMAWRLGYLDGQPSDKYWKGKEDLDNVEIVLDAIRADVD